MRKFLLTIGLVAATFSMSPVRAETAVSPVDGNNIEDQRLPRPMNRQVLIGQTWLNHYRTQAVINTRTCASQAGRLEAIRLQVLYADVDINYVIVQFGNGQTQRFNFGGELRVNQTSRWLNLSGRSERCIARILIDGDTQNSNFWSRGLVRVWARM